MAEINTGGYGSSSRARRVPFNYRHLIYRHVIGIRLMVDTVLIGATSIISGVLYDLVSFGVIGDMMAFIGAAVVVGSLLVPTLYLRGLYHPAALLEINRQAVQIALHWASAFAVLMWIAFAFKIGAAFSRGATFCFAGLGLLALLIDRAFCAAWLNDAITHGRMFGRRIALVTLSTALDVCQIKADLQELGFDIVKHESNKGDFDSSCRRDLFEVVARDLRGSDVEAVYITADWAHSGEVSPLLKLLQTIPLPVHIIPDPRTADLFQKPWHAVGKTVAAQVQREPLSNTERATKRVFDLIFGVVGLMVLSPLMLITAVAIKLDSPGTILFRQTRLGFNGRAFRILKFRTMSVLEDGNMITQARRDDVRITHVGRFLRSTSIDEIPQLVNVIRGHMSIVGPRPHAIAHDNYYEKLIAAYASRQHVKPGLTGWAQVNGCRGQTPTVDRMAQRVDLDTWYINNWSIWLDLRIVLRTFSVLIKNGNAW